MQNRILVPLTIALVAASLQGGCLTNTLPINPGGGGGDGGQGGDPTGQGGDIHQGGFGGDGGDGGDGGAGVGGAGGTTGTDGCPGDPFELAIGAGVSLPGTTLGLTDDSTSYCGTGTGSGPDAYYTVTALASGTLTFSLASSGDLNGVLYAQETCGDQSFYCSDKGDGVESFSFAAEEGTPYTIVVDGRDGTAGDYVLSAELTTSLCGDGVINAPLEECDFGDTNPGDGCDAACQFEDPMDDSDACPGEVYPVGTTPLVISSHTTGYTDDYTSCGAQTGSPDRVFALFTQASGTMTIRLPNLGPPPPDGNSGFDGVLAVWQGSCDAGNPAAPSYLGCSDGAVATDEEVLTFTVAPGALYFVVVDGYASYSLGNFQLTVSIN